MGDSDILHGPFQKGSKKYVEHCELVDLLMYVLVGVGTDGSIILCTAQDLYSRYSEQRTCTYHIFFQCFFNAPLRV